MYELLINPEYLHPHKVILGMSNITSVCNLSCLLLRETLEGKGVTLYLTNTVSVLHLLSRATRFRFRFIHKGL